MLHIKCVGIIPERLGHLFRFAELYRNEFPYSKMCLMLQGNEKSTTDILTSFSLRTSTLNHDTVIPV